MNAHKQDRFRTLVADDDLKTAFAELETLIKAEAPLLMDDLVLLRRRFNTMTKDRRVGTLSAADYDAAATTLARDFLYLVNQIPTDEELNAGGKGTSTATRGKLLHDIPSDFPLGRQTKCVIRIADTEKALLDNFTAGKDTVIEDNFPIQKVMSVALLDTQGGKCFEIQPLNTSIQRLVATEVTQWLFYVKALVPGDHVLILRVSTVEVINGVGRTKEVILERKVKVKAIIRPRPRTENRVWYPTKITIGPADKTKRSAFAPKGTQSKREERTITAKLPQKPGKAASSSGAGNRNEKPNIIIRRRKHPINVQNSTRSDNKQVSSKHKKNRSGTSWGKFAAVLLMLIIGGTWAVDYFRQDSADIITDISGPIGQPGKITNSKGNSNSQGLYPSAESIIGPYQSPQGLRGIIISGSGNRLYLLFDGNEYDISLISNFRFKLEGSDEVFQFIFSEDGKISGFEPVSKPGSTWLKQ